MSSLSADFVPAKKGFIAITQKTRFAYSMLASSGMRQTTHVGIVDSVTREGEVKRVRSLNNGGTETPRDWDTIVILDPAKLTDADGFFAECTKRQSTDPEKWQPFADINDVRETARKYR